MEREMQRKCEKGRREKTVRGRRMGRGEEEGKLLQLELHECASRCAKPSAHAATFFGDHH